MIHLVGALCFGLVLGWLTTCLVHHSRPGWRELKAVLAILSSAAMQTVFGGFTGLALYAAGSLVGAALYCVTLAIGPLRCTHDFTFFPRR